MSYVICVPDLHCISRYVCIQAQPAVNQMIDAHIPNGIVHSFSEWMLCGSEFWGALSLHTYIGAEKAAQPPHLSLTSSVPFAYSVRSTLR